MTFLAKPVIECLNKLGVLYLFFFYPKMSILGVLRFAMIQLSTFLD